MTLETLPPVLLKSRDLDACAAVTTGLGAMLLSATARAAEAAVLAQLVAEDLLRHLHMKLHECGKAQRRSRSTLGKWGNVLMGADPDYVELRGSHLSQTLKLLCVEDHMALDMQETYLLRADIARTAHDALGAQLGVAPDVLARGLT